MTFDTDCDLITGKSGDEPYECCEECYRFDLCQKYFEKEAHNEQTKS